jgi:hypothetical protein
MTEEERGFAPADPSGEDDLLAPEGIEDQEGKSEEVDETKQGPGSRRLQRQFVRIGWAAVAVLAVVGALIAVALFRISNEVNRNACILRAQASFLEAQGPGVTAPFAGLDRLSGQNQLANCGQ